MQAIIQILKVNEARSGTKDGRQWEMQDAECLLLNDDGSVSQVGVLQLPKELRGKNPDGSDKVRTGTYTGAFALRPDMASRRINAVLTGLTPYTVKGTPAASSKASGA